MEKLRLCCKCKRKKPLTQFHLKFSEKSERLKTCTECEDKYRNKTTGLGSHGKRDFWGVNGDDAQYC